MRLPSYNSIEEKSKIFEGRYQCIDNWKDLKELLNSLENVPNNLYRGMCEAKYKNYTSIQRYYLTHELEKTGLTIGQIVQKQIELLSTMNDSLLERYFKNMGIRTNWYLLNSFLQHYGGKTPLLDFTRSHWIALYFILDGCQVYSGGKYDIDNYCSLYYVDDLKLDCLQNLITTISKRFSDTIDKCNKKIDGVDKEKYAYPFKIAKENIDIWTQNTKEYIKSLFTPYFYNSSETFLLNFGMDDTVLFLNEDEVSLDYEPLKIHERIVTTTNLNSVAQESVFIMTFGTKPYEGECIHCIDIHKSLIPSIREIIINKGITKEKIFPQEETIAKQAFEQSLVIENYTSKE